MHIIRIYHTKAYDKVTVEELMVGFHPQNMPTKLAKTFETTMMERSARFVAPGIPETQTTRLRKGLAQGCPASPWLLTMVLETVVAPLVRRWQENSVGHIVGDRHMPVHTFADDLYLRERFKYDVQVMVQDLMQALQANSLALQPAKFVWMAVQRDAGRHEELRAGRGDLIPRVLGTLVDVVAETRWEQRWRTTLTRHGPRGAPCAHFCA